MFNALTVSSIGIGVIGSLIGALFYAIVVVILAYVPNI